MPARPLPSKGWACLADPVPYACLRSWGALAKVRVTPASGSGGSPTLSASTRSMRLALRSHPVPGVLDVTNLYGFDSRRSFCSQRLQSPRLQNRHAAELQASRLRSAPSSPPVKSVDLIRLARIECPAAVTLPMVVVEATCRSLKGGDTSSYCCSRGGCIHRQRLLLILYIT